MVALSLLLLCCLHSGQVQLAGSRHLWCLLRYQGARGRVEHQGVETLHQAEADEDNVGDLHIAGEDGSVKLQLEHW